MNIPCLPYAAARSFPELRWADLRSPGEFQRDHVPGAINVPLFDDAQRAAVGTLYRQASKGDAYDQGLAFAESAMPELLGQLLGRTIEAAEWQPCFEQLGEQLRGGQESVDLGPELPEQKPTLALYCWRGGMRSRSVSALLQALGETVLLLDGGYKNYRNWVLKQTEGLQLPELIVLRGPTGVGKTEILARLEQQHPGSTLCLESLAQHRSSILGAVGKEPVSQPSFDTRLLQRIGEMGPGPWFIEGESRKVGDVILPANLYEAMEKAHHWRLEASTETRVRNLMDDYLISDGSVDAIREQLPMLERRIGLKWVGQLDRWMAEGRAAEVTEVLLERYYDPLYAHSDERREWSVELTVEDPDLIVKMLRERTSI
ncbi:MAG: tRNA 2-selenouridine(34) synthase MnmH [Planctomycetota bacterium]|nr:MAG: tRNA 2-selenouridine(34) synthase MnmH [Planctomycetota bacterium]